MRIYARWRLFRRSMKKWWSNMSYETNRNKYCMRGPGPKYRAKHS